MSREEDVFLAILVFAAFGLFVIVNEFMRVTNRLLYEIDKLMKRRYLK